MVVDRVVRFAFPLIIHRSSSVDLTLFYPENSSVQEIEINELKKYTLDLVFMRFIHPPICWGQSIQNTDQKWGRSSVPF